MSAQLKLLSSLAVLASSIAIVSPLELGASATLPMHLSSSSESPAESSKPQVNKTAGHSPLQQIAAQVRGWDSGEAEGSDASAANSDNSKAEQDGPEPHSLDKSFRQFMFNKYGSFFFGSNEG